METQIQIKCNPSDKKIIVEASKITSLGYSSFCRMASLEKARIILKQNEEGSQKA